MTRVRWEQSPRGRIRISGTRGGSALSVELTADDWGIQARPQMPDETLSQYEEGETTRRYEATQAGSRDLAAGCPRG